MTICLKVYFATAPAMRNALADILLGGAEQSCEIEKAIWYRVREDLVSSSVDLLRSMSGEYEIVDWETFDVREYYEEEI